MKKKKALSAVALLMAVLTGLSGCGMTKGPESQAQASTGENAGGLKEVSVGYANDAWFKYEGNETQENNSWTQLMNENGIQLKTLYSVEASQQKEKLAQCVMSGEYPDVVVASNTTFRDFAEQGVFYDLTEAFEKYASEETKAYYQDIEAGRIAFEAGKVDGKLYALPEHKDPYNKMTVLWLRKDWLDNLGLQAPKTIDEFYEVARAFSEDDPDGNGVRDTYGLALSGKEFYSQMGTMSGVFEMYGAMPVFDIGVVPFIELDGHAAFGGADVDTMTQALNLYADMYQNKYIPEDFVTAGVEQVVQLLSAGTCGMAFGRMPEAGAPWANALATQPDAEFIAVPLPGVTEEEAGKAFYSAVPMNYFGMSSKFDDPEAFMTMVNLSTKYISFPDALTLEEFEKYNGKAGEYTGWKCAPIRLTSAEKNLNALERHQKALAGDTSELNAENLANFNAMQDYLNNKDRRAELTEEEIAKFNSGLFYYAIWGNENCSYQAISEMIDMGNFTYSAYEAVPTKNMATYGPTLDTFMRENISDMIVGNASIDSYPSVLEQWNQLGGQVITAEADEWYQTQ